MAPLPPHVRVAVIGAGFAGLGAAKALADAGITDVVVLERRDGLGGTWWDNTYPGVACDIPSRLYSFSFAPNPSWSRAYASGTEIQRYLEGVADRFDLRRLIRFGCTLSGATWQEAQCHWSLETSDGQFTADILIAATGPLSQPSIPGIPGLDTFAGVACHTAQWRPNLDLAGKRVAVVGTGASAVQVVPQIQPSVAALTLFQRTPPWVLRKHDRRITGFEHALHRRFPALQRLTRAAVYASREAGVVGFVRHPAVMRAPRRMALRHLAEEISDPVLRAALTPSYSLGCKRVTPSDEYYPALAKPNVSVVPAALARVEGDVLVGSDGSRHQVDVILLATGFEATVPPLAAMVTGRDGRTLRQTWEEGGMQALRGTTVSGFPNLFLMIGPNTGLGHNSMIYMIESQLPYVIDAIRRMDSAGVAAVDADPAAQRRWNAELQRRMPSTVWLRGGCASWYQDTQGRVTTLWPFSTLAFRRRLRRFDPREYVVLRRATNGATGVPATAPACQAQAVAR